MRRAFRAAAVSCAARRSVSRRRLGPRDDERQSGHRGPASAGVAAGGTYQVNVASAATRRASTRRSPSRGGRRVRRRGARRPHRRRGCTDFRFVKGPPTTQTAVAKDGVNLVVFRTSRCSDVVPALDPCLTVPRACAAKYNCWDYEFSTAGYTTHVVRRDDRSRSANGHGAVRGGRHVPRRSGRTSRARSPAADACTSVRPDRLQRGGRPAVVTHEAGHVLGLDHVCSDEFRYPTTLCPSAAPVMTPSVGNVSASRRSPPTTSTGICTIYPLGGATLTCAPPDPPSSGGCACGGGAGIASLLAVFAARRRSRRA